MCVCKMVHKYAHGSNCVGRLAAINATNSSTNETQRRETQVATKMRGTRSEKGERKGSPKVRQTSHETLMAIMF